MAWFSRITRFADVHLVYGQEENMSCGIASVMMCVFKINKLKPGAQALHVEKEIYDKYSAASGKKYQPSTKGTHPTHLVTVLNDLDCGTWKWHSLAGAAASQKILDTVGKIEGLGPVVACNPVILGVDWDGGGAHWVVIDTIRIIDGKKYVTICDPWDTNVHIEPIAAGTAFSYDPGKGGFMLSFGGTHKGMTSPYAVTDRGTVKNWGIICRE